MGDDENTRSRGPTSLGQKKPSLLGRLRVFCLLRIKHRFAKVGADFFMGRGTYIRPNCVSMGAHCYIGNHCYIASDVEAGNWVMIASYVSMVGGDHAFRVPGTPAIASGRGENKPIIIEDDVWIGHGAIIMHGVRVGEGAVIAAGALVTRDVPPYAIVASEPSRVVGQRFTGDDLIRHKQALEQLRNTTL